MKKHRVLLGGILASVILFAFFFILQARNSSLLGLPIQWLVISVIPIALTLIAGGYIKTFEAGKDGFKFEGIDQELEKLPEAESNLNAPSTLSAGETLQNERTKEYERTHKYFLIHSYKPSNRRGQKFDVYIYVVRHTRRSMYPQRTNLDEIEYVEFYLGNSWRNRVFRTENSSENIFGLQVHAYGTFLATCRVVFKDSTQSPIILHRYIDGEMLLLENRYN